MSDPTQPPLPGVPPPAEPKTVKMEAIKDGTYDGFPFQVGDTIDVEEPHVEAMQNSGTAVRADRVEVAEQARQAREAASKAAADRKNPVTKRTR